MAEANQQQEPSMEEILSSIRRIISADTTTEEAEKGEEAESPPPPPADEEPAEEDEDVLELTDVVDEPQSDDELDIDVDEEIESFQPGEHFGPAMLADEEEPEPHEPPPPPPEPEPQRREARHDEGLVSPPTEAASMAAFASLNDVAAGGRLPFDVGGRTVEQLAAELMRPILKEWLDQNLPSMVERLVRAEIKRLAEQSQRR